MSIPAKSLLTRSLRENPWGEKASRILAAALDAVDPARLIQDSLIREGSKIILPKGVIDLELFDRVFLLSVGKAALPLAVSAADLIGDHLAEGHILTKDKKGQIPDRFLEKLLIHTGSHPVPDQEGQRATKEILTRLSSLQKHDLVIVLISGGCSALLTCPAQGISLTDLRKTNQVLLSCGADIREINTIRKHLSQVKGGQLAKYLQPARILTLILSDVIGDPIDMIGSGPTAPDPSTYGDALDIIRKYRLEKELPDPVFSRMEQGYQGSLLETPKPGDPSFSLVSNLILGNNQKALEAGAAQAETEGFKTSVLPHPLVGEASDVGRNLAKKISGMALKGEPLPRPACLIAGGETTVTLTNTEVPGHGGRNLEVALSAMSTLDGLENIALITLATDGEDGLTDAAGAVVTGDSYRLCQGLGLEPEANLRRHDSHPIFKALGDLIITGPTGTNVNDICFLFTV